MTRDQILNLAEKHRSKLTGWYFTAAGLEKLWRGAYERGRRSELENKRKWIGLTIEELQEIYDSFKLWNTVNLTDYYTAIEAKLKEKNG